MQTKWKYAIYDKKTPKNHSNETTWKIISYRSSILSITNCDHKIIEYEKYSNVLVLSVLYYLGEVTIYEA